MSELQYQGIILLIFGISFFVIMLLSLRLVAEERKLIRQEENNDDSWHGIEELQVVEIIQETPNVKSFRFIRGGNKIFPEFHGGQFISFQIGSDETTTRSYSISSSASNRAVLQVSIKELKDGKGSRWFHKLEKGDWVLAFPPNGHFTDLECDERHRVFIAGGIGITPVLSIILSKLDHAITHKMSLFYGVRTQEDLAFHGLFEYLAQRHHQFEYYPILSDDGQWPEDKGYLSVDFLKSKLESFNNKKYFLCGPEVMTEPIIVELEKCNLPEGAIVTEKFVSPTNIDQALISDRQLTLKFEGETFAYNGRMDILSFLESQGKALPFACRSGVCGSCKCKINGSYKMLTDAGLTRKQLKEGFALACVSFPESDIEISV